MRGKVAAALLEVTQEEENQIIITLTVPLAMV
jgi:hypothetical protein